MANVRGIEFICRTFCLRHQDFRGEMQILKGTLEARCIALKILTKLNFDSSIIGEIAYQGAFAKVIKVYTAKQTSTLGAHQTVAKEFTST